MQPSFFNIEVQYNFSEFGLHLTMCPCQTHSITSVQDLLPQNLQTGLIFFTIDSVPCILSITDLIISILEPILIISAKDSAEDYSRISLSIFGSFRPARSKNLIIESSVKFSNSAFIWYFCKMATKELKSSLRICLVWKRLTSWAGLDFISS